MANVNGINYAVTQGEKLKKVAPGEKNGRVKILQEKYTFAGELTAGDVVLGMSLPNGAKVLNAKMLAPVGFTVGSFSLGYGASEDKDGVAIAADAAGLVASTAFGSAAIGLMKASSPLWDVKLGAEMAISATVTVTTTVATGLDLIFHVEYVVD